jgi:hypothetical protein
MNTAAHPVAPEEVMALLDGELSAEQAHSISTHLEQCSECSEIVALFRDTSHCLSEWTVPAAVLNAEFEEHLSAAVGVESTKLQATGGSRSGVFSRRGWRFAVVSAGLVGVLISMILMNSYRYERSYSVAKSVAEKRIMVQEHGKRQIGADALRPQTSAQDSNGAFRGLGDHVQDSFSIDGHLIPDQQSRVFSNQLPRDSIEAGQAVLPGPMIARTVSLVMVVKQFDASRASLEAILVRHKGYSSNLAINTPEGAARSLDASLRVPVSQLAATIAELKALGRVELETQGGEEVTQQHADLIARLKIARETEHRFIAILRDRPGNISEVLSTEESIARVRGEIEQMEAQQQNLEHRVDFATINLRLAEEYKAQLSSPAPSVATQVRNASVNGFRGAFESVLAVVLFLAESGPAILLWLVLLLLPARMLWRRYRRSLALSSSLGA